VSSRIFCIESKEDEGRERKREKLGEEKGSGDRVSQLKKLVGSRKLKRGGNSPECITFNRDRRMGGLFGRLTTRKVQAQEAAKRGNPGGTEAYERTS